MSQFVVKKLQEATQGIEARAMKAKKKCHSNRIASDGGLCINCGVKLCAVDEDPSGDFGCVCARCVAEESHDFDLEPQAKYDRAGHRIDA